MDEEQLAPYLKALGSDDPFGNLIRLVIDFKKSGDTQEQAQELLHSVRVNTGSYEAGDARDELLCEVLDCVTGWCSSHIFAEDFDEGHFFRPLPPSPKALQSTSSQPSVPYSRLPSRRYRCDSATLPPFFS